MKKPLLRSFLSYFWEQHIESRSSFLNPELHVSLVDGRYQLCTRNAIYSFEDKYANFTETFKRLDLDRAGFQKVLLPGFGLGSIPYMLEKKFKQKYDYTGIEIDEEVIALASKYLLPDLESKVNLILGDAYQFLVETEEKYDLISVDIFQDAVIPEQFESPGFLDLLKDAITPDGLIVFNRLYHTKEDEAKTEEYYENIFRKSFPEAGYISAGGNWVLLSHTKLLRKTID